MHRQKSTTARACVPCARTSSWYWTGVFLPNPVGISGLRWSDPAEAVEDFAIKGCPISMRAQENTMNRRYNTDDRGKMSLRQDSISQHSAPMVLSHEKIFVGCPGPTSFRFINRRPRWTERFAVSAVQRCRRFSIQSPTCFTWRWVP